MCSDVKCVVCSGMQSCRVGCVKQCEVLSCGLYAMVCSVAMWVEGWIQPENLEAQRGSTTDL